MRPGALFTLPRPAGRCSLGRAAESGAGGQDPAPGRGALRGTRARLRTGTVSGGSGAAPGQGPFWGWGQGWERGKPRTAGRPGACPAPRWEGASGKFSGLFQPLRRSTLVLGFKAFTPKGSYPWQCSREPPAGAGFQPPSAEHRSPDGKTSPQGTGEAPAAPPKPNSLCGLRPERHQHACTHPPVPSRNTR